MVSFSMLPALLRSLFALWTLLLCLINIGSGVLAAVKKHLAYTAFAILLFVPSYFMWQVIFDYSLIEKMKHISEITQRIVLFPTAYLLIAFVALTIASAVLFLRNIKFDRTFITPGTIKLYLDKVPCGICCWRENGRILFSNVCINELCMEVSSTPLLNGNHFNETVKDGILKIGDKVWRFVCNEIELDGEKLREMIASDITDENAKTEALKNDNARISQLNRELQDYYISIDESVKRTEILQAKMNIHDEMNRLMLLTVSCDKEDVKKLDKVFSLWEQNSLLLCMEADKKASNQKSESLNALAKSLGINLKWDMMIPKTLTDEQKELFFFTSQEALINAVKHAAAKEMTISAESGEGEVVFRFTNNGKIPTSEIHYEGGLANIEYLAGKQGATVSVELSEAFTLVLQIKLS
ncbi:MAG: hypothetical protein IJR70_02395 [Eubacterium sp.]|nr:hypothetical protein [Eubacterium sp.]